MILLSSSTGEDLHHLFYLLRREEACLDQIEASVGVSEDITFTLVMIDLYALSDATLMALVRGQIKSSLSFLCSPEDDQ